MKLIPVESLPFKRPEKLGPLKAWSFSALKTFEECAYRAYLSRVQKIPEPTNPAASRGSKIHEQAEAYVKSELDEMPEELKKFAQDFDHLRALYADARVELEGDWGFTMDWEPTAWVGSTTWVRIKLDALVFEEDNSARVIDYKTGKKWGNEITHGQQCLLYAIGTFYRYPEIEAVQTELWYLDKQQTTKKFYTRNEALNFAASWHNRGVAMTTEENFTPSPSASACRWCSYKTGNPAPCEWGVT